MIMLSVDVIDSSDISDDNETTEGSHIKRAIKHNLPVFRANPTEEEYLNIIHAIRYYIESFRGSEQRQHADNHIGVAYFNYVVESKDIDALVEFLHNYVSYFDDLSIEEDYIDYPVEGEE